jgi:nucleotide-binding universal stress UspA family protein
MSAPILAAYSLQDADRGPIEFAVAAARFTGAPLVVASVLSGGSPLDRLTGGEFHDVADEPGTLDALRSELAGLDVPASVHVVEHHSPAGGIAAAIEELRPRLAVLGSSNRSAVGRVLAGSTAERVIHGSPCPVVVVPQGHQAPSEGAQLVGAAFAPTPEGKAALAAGALLARALNARLLAVMVLNPKHAERQSPGLMAQAHGEHDPSEDRYVRDRLVGSDALQAAIAELGEGVEVEPDVLFQDPLEGLTAASQRTDLLVIGSRGYGPAKAVMLGGISRRLIAAAHCPLLVLPRADAQAVGALVGGEAGSSRAEST